jgi:hypothetical protein
MLDLLRSRLIIPDASAVHSRIGERGGLEADQSSKLANEIRGRTSAVMLVWWQRFCGTRAL